MMKSTRLLPVLLYCFLVFTSCHVYYRAGSLEYQQYRVGQIQQPDSLLRTMLSPYRDSISSSMHTVIGFAAKSMEKKQPESELGNFLADAMLVMAREEFRTTVDAAFINFGGIRLTRLQAGAVTRGTVYELMPFDNVLILQKMKGDVLQQFLDLVAARGGWPLSGLRMQIRGRKAVNVMIDGQPLDHMRTYTIANSDYIANGGDDADMLRPIPQISRGYLVRDAFIEYIKRLNAAGQPVSANLDNRVTNEQ